MKGELCSSPFFITLYTALYFNTGFNAHRSF